MDDLIVLTQTRHQLKKAVRCTHKIVQQLNLTLHPDKTYIGRIKKGFDYLGFHIKPPEVKLSLACLWRAVTKAWQLFEQTRDILRVQRYWLRFLQWGKQLLQGLVNSGGEHSAMGQRRWHRDIDKNTKMQDP